MKSLTRREKLAALLAEGEDDELLKIEINPRQEQINKQNQASRDAEALLAFIRGTSMFVKKMCLSCNTQFYTDYSCVAYCTDSCRRHALESIGIKWNPTRPLEQRWGNPVPLVIPNSTLEHLKICLGLTQPQDIPLPEPLQESTQPETSANGHSQKLPELPDLPDLDLEFDLL